MISAIKFVITNHPLISFFLIAFFSILFSYSISCIRLNEINKNPLKISSDSLDKQFLFWFLISTPLFIFFYLESLVFMKYGFEFDIFVWNYTFKNSIFPISILTLSPILGAFITHIHRSVQTETQIKKTEEQIKITSKKNNSDLYYSHLKFITDELKRISIERKIENKKDVTPLFSYKHKNTFNYELNIQNEISLYRKVFNESSPSEGAIIIPSEEIKNGLLNIVFSILNNVIIINNRLISFRKIIKKIKNRVDKRNKEKSKLQSTEEYTNPLAAYNPDADDNTNFIEKMKKLDNDLSLIRKKEMNDSRIVNEMINNLNHKKNDIIGCVIHNLLFCDIKELNEKLNINKIKINIPIPDGKEINKHMFNYIKCIIECDTNRLSEEIKYLEKLEMILHHTKVIIGIYCELIPLVMDIFSFENRELSKIIDEINDSSMNLSISNHL